MPLSFYQPRERVEGGNRPPAPRVAPALEIADRRPLQEAADYAAKSDSNALIVTRHGHIVFEQYWHGTEFDTLEDAQSFMRTLNAVLVGVAIIRARSVGRMSPSATSFRNGATTRAVRSPFATF